MHQRACHARVWSRTEGSGCDGMQGALSSTGARAHAVALADKVRDVAPADRARGACGARTGSRAPCKKEDRCITAERRGIKQQLNNHHS